MFMHHKTGQYFKPFADFIAYIEQVSFLFPPQSFINNKINTIKLMESLDNKSQICELPFWPFRFTCILLTLAEFMNVL